MITRVRESQEQRTERQMAEWAREIDAARLSGTWSSKLQHMETQLDTYFRQQPDWDAEEIAYMQQRRVG